MNPVYAGQKAFGNSVYKSLATIPKKQGPVDMVDIFRRLFPVCPPPDKTGRFPGWCHQSK
ncbi:MAG: hypothetical protein AAF399_28105 [Bacteroidota bacterium]